MISGFIDTLFEKVLDRVENKRRLKTQLHHHLQLGPEAKLMKGAEIVNLNGDPNAISIGSHSLIRGQLLVFWNGGNIRIGEWSYVGESSRIWSQSSVSIGNNVLISHLVDIHDTDSHPIDFRERRDDARRILGGSKYEQGSTQIASVIIEDDVWIGFKASILKGVRIGAGAIIAAGSIVTKDVPNMCVVAGQPARVIRTLE